ncbi:MAG: TIGR03013 family XrtA/PEP-CTERM system glycosyltransferase [Burkholderiaceae bacterium]
MIRIFGHYMNRRLLLQVVFDFGLIVALMIAAFLLYVERSTVSISLVSATATQGFSLAAAVFVINTASGFYQPSYGRTFGQTCARAALASMFALPVAYFIFRLLPVDAAGGEVMGTAAMISVAAVIAHRVYAAHSSSATTRRSRVMVLGSGMAAQVVGNTLRESDPFVEVVGYIRAPNEKQLSVPAAELITLQKTLAHTAARADVSEIVVALTERRGGSMPMRDLLDCKIQGIMVCDLATHFERRLGQIRIDYVNAGWLIFGDGFNQGVFRPAVKRIFDIAMALLLLAVSSPVILLTMALITLSSRGPIFYTQPRVGLNGKHFHVIKFRSMKTDAERDGTPRWARAGDDRVTPLGRIIRKFRIDELPQLINVLKGEMSMVGPRPERPFFVDKLVDDIPYYSVRHSLKPGLTGWAQVRYHYGATVDDSQQKLQYDLYYVKNHTLFLDLLIMLETVAVVLTGKGAH